MSAPKYVQTAKIGTAMIAAANPSRNGTGSMGTVLTGGENDTKITDVVVQATGTTTDGMVRLFLVSPTGMTAILTAEIPVKATTPTEKIPAFAVSLKASDLDILPFDLPKDWLLKASTHKAEAFNVVALAGDYGPPSV